jgi:transposase
MSTDILYHALDLQGYEIIQQTVSSGEIVLHIEPLEETLCCPNCGSQNIIRRGRYERFLRGLSFGHTPLHLVVEVPRVQCKDCGALRRVTVALAHGLRSYTKAFERYVLELSRHMAMQDVARHLRIGWDIVKDIQRRYLLERFGEIEMGHLRQIAIDEISIGRGHRYLTVVLDLLSGAVVFVGDGKGADALSPFWALLKKAQARIEAVATDMSPAFISAVMGNLPDAVLVFDHFHVIKLFNDKLSDFRRELHREATQKLEKDVLKGTRWLLLKNPENLDDTKNETQRLQEALKLNEPLACAYYMKEELRTLWDQRNKAAAGRLLKSWITRAEKTGIGMLKKFSNTLAAHRNQILNYYDYPITTGPLEGTNTKIRVMQRQAYGFRDHEFLKLKILGLHETRIELIG